MHKRHTLILFDIDGTLLIYKDGLPNRMFAEMVAHFFQKEIVIPRGFFSGKTDKAIIAEVMELAEIPRDHHFEKEQEMMDWIVSYVQRVTSPDSFHLLPNVKPLLDALSAKSDTTVALLTGNLERCAEIKLGHFGLSEYFKFGAFGEISPNRNDLGPVALEKFSKLSDGASVIGEDVVVIGDTIADILCAKHIGAKCIITLTGRASREMIEPYSPHHIFDDLSDTEKVLHAIYN